MESTSPSPSLATSLLDPKSTGGIRAWNGFAVQYRYTALRIPDWLGQPDFDWFQSERVEDIDVDFNDGRRDYYQVKTAQHSAADVRALIAEFRTRNADVIREGRIGRYVLACTHLTTIRGFADALAIHDAKKYGVGDDDLRRRTVATLREQAENLGLGRDFDFIVAHVRFDQDVAGLASGEGGRDRLAVRLGDLLGVDRIDESKVLAERLLKALAEEPHRAWHRADLNALLAREREVYRRGPPRPAGDLILFRHETLKHVGVEPAPGESPALFGERRVIRAGQNAVSRMRLDADVLDEIVAELVATDGAYREALRDQDSRLLYFGFPHVPFAGLAGFLAQEQREVALIEHDREMDRFCWRLGEPALPPHVAVTEVLPSAPVDGHRSSLSDGHQAPCLSAALG